MVSKGYRDNSAMGEAPTGSPPQGQKAGEMFPGGCHIPIVRGSSDPSDRSLRMANLDRTLERGSEKRHAGQSAERMAINHLRQDNRDGAREAKEHNELIGRLQSSMKKGR
jgi:hypothetical protein